jgi:hypothetical protein
MLSTTAGGLALPIDRREGRARVRDLNTREIDSVVDAQYVRVYSLSKFVIRNLERYEKRNWSECK